MTSATSYEFVSSHEKGMIVVAKKDFLTGELVMEEKEPILFFSNAGSVSLGPQRTESDMNRVAYSTFCELSAERKRLLMSLYGPTTGPFADTLRTIATIGGLKIKNRELSTEEIETFVKVSSITRLNAFGDKDGSYIFGKVTRFAHSCQPNCRYFLHGGGCSVRANRFIKAGEELSISYVEERDTTPTHERRFQYSAYKDFTCHCPRCDAPGDDTRQFDCFDSDCKGVMMVCQPINQELCRGSPCFYTGVEYQKPHLLPCTVCHRAPPADYQAKMLALEGYLPTLAQKFAALKFSVAGLQASTADYESLLAELTSLKLPRRHLSCLFLLCQEMKASCLELLKAARSNNTSTTEPCLAHVRRAASDYLEAIERVLPYAHASTYKVLHDIVGACIVQWWHYQDLTRTFNPTMHIPLIFSPLEAKALLQQTLRMHLVLDSRENRTSELDAALLRALSEAIPSCVVDAAVINMEVCAFCEESPQCAAFTLSRCSRCKQVAYCSVGCQKAHWKLHKKSCKAAIASEMKK